jgi:uncharacterized DUF497 family protein
VQKIIIKKLTWDAKNISHIARHQVTPAEVEEVCRGDRIERQGFEQRAFLVGKSRKGRFLGVVLGPTDATDVYRPITAFDASKASIKEYLEEKNRGGEQAA